MEKNPTFLGGVSLIAFITANSFSDIKRNISILQKDYITLVASYNDI